MQIAKRKLLIFLKKISKLGNPFCSVYVKMLPFTLTHFYHFIWAKVWSLKQILQVDINFLPTFFHVNCKFPLMNKEQKHRISSIETYAKQSILVGAPDSSKNRYISIVLNEKRQCCQFAGSANERSHHNALAVLKELRHYKEVISTWLTPPTCIDRIRDRGM